jgi:hypothetical protein
MKFDISKFEANLQMFRKKEPNKEVDQSGIVQVVKYIWNHQPTAEIDFDSFTVEDVEEVMEILEELPLLWNDGGEYFTCDPNNPFMIFDQISSVLFTLTNTPNKRFIFDEEDFFI